MTWVPGLKLMYITVDLPSAVAGFHCSLCPNSICCVMVKRYCMHLHLPKSTFYNIGPLLYNIEVCSLSVHTVHVH